MNRDILDELAVPTPPYRAWRATLAAAPIEESKKESPPAQGLGTMKSALEKAELQKEPTPAEASAEIRSKMNQAIDGIKEMKGVPEDKKRAAIAELDEILRLQLEANTKMPEPEVEKKSDTSATVILPRIRINSSKEEVMMVPGKDGGDKSIRYDKAEKPKGSQVGDVVVVGQSKAKVLEVGANGEPTRLDAFEGPAAQVAPQPAPKPVEQKPEAKEPEPKSPKVVISAKPIGDGKIASKFGPGAEPGESKEQKIFEPTTPKEAAPITPEVGSETIYVKPVKKAKEELPENKQLLEDRMTAFGGGMSNGKFDGLKKEVTPPNRSKEEQAADQEQLRKDEERIKQEERARREDINYKSGVTRAQKEAIKMDKEWTVAQKKAKEFRSTDTQPYVPLSPEQQPKMSAEKEAPAPKEEPMSRREFLGLPKTESTPVTTEVGSETVYVKPEVRAEQKPEAPVVAPEKVEARPRFDTARQLIKSLWEKTGIGLKSETFWARTMANLNDGAANYWLGPVLRGKGRLEKYQDKAKNFEEKMNDSNFQFTRDWYRKRMLKAQGRATMAESRLGIYTMKKEMYESRRADYSREVARKYEAYIAPYEARIRGAKELIDEKSAAEDTLRKTYQEQLVKISELEKSAKTRWGGLVKDRESVKKIKAAEKILQGIDKELARSQKERFKQQSEIARFTERVAPWKARQKSILQFADQKQ